MKKKVRQMSLATAKALVRKELLLIHNESPEQIYVDKRLNACKSIQAVCNALGDFGFDFDDAVDFILCCLVK
jgi:hypothetical protein